MRSQASAVWQAPARRGGRSGATDHVSASPTCHGRGALGVVAPGTDDPSTQPPSTIPLARRPGCVCESQTARCCELQRAPGRGPVLGHFRAFVHSPLLLPFSLSFAGGCVVILGLGERPGGRPRWFGDVACCARKARAQPPAYSLRSSRFWAATRAPAGPMCTSCGCAQPGATQQRWHTTARCPPKSAPCPPVALGGCGAPLPSTRPGLRTAPTCQRRQAGTTWALPTLELHAAAVSRNAAHHCHHHHLMSQRVIAPLEQEPSQPQPHSTP